jgi:hypothetical protein
VNGSSEDSSEIQYTASAIETKQDHFTSSATSTFDKKIVSLSGKESNARTNTKIFMETSEEQDARIKANSPFRHLRTWKVLRVFIKSNDDIR